MSASAGSYIFFDLAGTTYGLPAGSVQHVEMLEQVTPVPNAARGVEGIVFSRGQVVPALDLRTIFGLPRQPRTARTRLIVVHFEERLVGLIVDEAREFRTISAGEIAPADATVSRLSGSYLEGTATVAGRFVLLPSLRSILQRSLPEASASASSPVAAAP